MAYCGTTARILSQIVKVNGPKLQGVVMFLFVEILRLKILGITCRRLFFDEPASGARTNRGGSAFDAKRQPSASHKRWFNIVAPKHSWHSNLNISGSIT